MERIKKITLAIVTWLSAAIVGMIIIFGALEGVAHNL